MGIFDRFRRRAAGPVAPAESLLGQARRALTVARRTGLLGQQSVAGLVRGLGLLVTHPVGPGLIHAINAGSFPDRLALVAGDVRFTYGELDDRLNQFVHALEGLGVGRNDRVVLMAPNGWEYVVAFFGAFRGGFTAVHASYRLKPPELEYLFTHSGARAIVFAPSCWPTVRAVRDGGAVDAARVVWIATERLSSEPGIPALPDLLERQSSAYPRRSLRGLADSGYRSLVYTSGTTGKPKGAVRDFAQNGIGDLNRILERLPVQAGERHLIVSPLYHSAAQVFTLLGAVMGSTVVVAPKFDPAATLRILDHEAIESVFLVPTMTRQILDLPESLRRRHRPRLRWLLSGAAPFPHPLRERAIDYFGAVVYDFYGATEMGWVTLVDSGEMLRKPGTLGRAVPGVDIYVAGPSGERLGPGEVGEIYAASPQVIEGYLDDQRATAESRLGEAQSAGDLGYLDEEGYLFLAGRAKEMILSGGVNIYPAEIEAVIATFPGIAEAAVVGLPDPEWGERVAAFVVREGPAAGGLGEGLDDEEALVRFCRERLANFKVPKAWFFVDALPRNPTGKVLKRTLRDRAHAGSAG